MSSTRLDWAFVLAILFLVLLTLPLPAYSQTALQFVSVTPCRIADTRNPPGQFGGPTMDANTSRDFPVPQSACDIPADAAAFSLNVTVVPFHHGSLNYLTIWPTGQTQPLVSTLNSYDGRTKANAAIVPAGNDGSVSVYVTNQTDVILDIDGYFVPATTTTLAFFPLTPCRVADTRNPQGPLGGPYLPAHQERDFPVLASPCNIPQSAVAYSLNMTVMPRTSAGLGYLTVWPTTPGSQPPNVSTLNAPNTVVANAAIVPGGVSGAISTYVTNDTNLIIDINGYFAPASTLPRAALSLFSLVPCRVLDNRPPGGSGAFIGTLPVDVLGSSCNVPGAQAYVFNATVVPAQGPMGYLSLWPDAEGQPVVSTLNAYDGKVTSNMAIVPTLNGDVDAYAYNSTYLLMDISAYFAPILPLTVTTTALPAGTVNYGYSTTLAAAGGVLPYTWSTTVGSLPLGLNLDPASGTISGIPTVAQNYPFTVQVTDSETPPASVSAPLSINVTDTVSTLTITTATLPNGNQNSPYNVTLAANGGVTPYAWSISSGSLPSGLHLNSSTGTITGTPTGGGLSTFTVQVSDSELPTQVSVRLLSITINPAVPLSITTTTLPDGVAGSPYSAPIVAIGGVYPYTWSVIAGKLPDGLTLNSSTGVVSGSPWLPGPKSFTVQVTDSETPSVSASGQITMNVNSPGGNGNPGLLSGNYAFYLNGFNASGAWTLAGSFISDGNGNITSGMIDYNSVTGQPINTAVSGTYAISAAGLNLLTLQGAGWGPVTFAFVLKSSGDSGRIIEYDDTTGQGSRGSGELRKATASAFSLGALNGGWVFGLTGATLHSDSSVKRFVDVGQFALANGSITGGTCDTNDGGTYQTCTFSGSASSINAQTGRGTVSIQSNNGPTHEVVYVVSSGELVMASTDSVPSTRVPLSVGLVELQSGRFSSASMDGTEVFVMQSIHGSDGLDQSVANLASFNGNGSFNVTAMDEDLAGTITQDAPQSGSYTVQSNGALSLNCQGGGCPIGFLFSANKGMVIGTGSSTLFGQFGPQTGGPFSNVSLNGVYVAGSLAPLDYANGRTEVDVFSSNGTGSFTVSSSSSNSDGIDQSFGTPVNYSIAANGRGTAEAQGDHAPSIVYMISPTAGVVLHPSPDAEMQLFER